MCVCGYRQQNTPYKKYLKFGSRCGGGKQNKYIILGNILQNILAYVTGAVIFDVCRNFAGKKL